MRTVRQAIELIQEHGAPRPLPPILQPLDQCLNRVLAAEIVAGEDHPPFDKSLVDGFAVSMTGLSEPRIWSVIETVHAGQTPRFRLGPGETTRVMTGAPLPEGADAVVMLEQVEEGDDGSRIVLPPQVALRLGQNRLDRGREIRAGDRVLMSGDRLTPPRLGLLAALGRAAVMVHPAPEVAILPTGDELVEPHEPLSLGQIRNSNATQLSAMSRMWSAVPRALPIARDREDELDRAVANGLDADLLLVCGGVSAGAKDLVPAALARQGVRQVFHRVRIKPGKPLWFGIGPTRGSRPGTLVFGLPGNPVSGLVGFLVFVAPLIELLGGRGGRMPFPEERAWSGRLDRPFSHRGDRPTFHPSRWIAEPGQRDSGLIVPREWAGSADLRAVADSDGFAMFPEGDQVHSAGSSVRFLPMLNECWAGVS